MNAILQLATLVFATVFAAAAPLAELAAWRRRFDDAPATARRFQHKQTVRERAQLARAFRPRAEVDQLRAAPAREGGPYRSC